MPLKFRILSKQGCHLCEEAKEIISRVTRQLPVEIEVVDIENDADLKAQYSNDIPVIFLNDRKIFKHRVDEHKLQAILQLATKALRTQR